MIKEKINAIIIDDEERSILLNQTMLKNYCHEVNIVAIYDSVDKAYEGIMTHKPDLIFLDIDMPPYTGFDLLRKFSSIDFEIIFITAFNQYAIDAIRFSALDYLMKPVNTEELQTAVKKAHIRIQSKNPIRTESYQHLLQSSEISKLVIRSQQGIEIINIQDILYFEAKNTYTEFITSAKRILSSKGFVEYEDMFHDKGFFRIHRSYMVNLAHIKGMDKKEGYEVLLNHTEDRLPLSRRRKQEFFEHLARIGK